MRSAWVLLGFLDHLRGLCVLLDRSRGEQLRLRVVRRLCGCDFHFLLLFKGFERN